MRLSIALLLLCSLRLSAATDCFSYQSHWGTAGNGSAELHNPTGLSAAGGNVYVGQSNQIKVFTAAGVHQGNWGSPGSGSGQFNDLSDLVNDGTHFYISDSGNHRIQKLDMNGAFVAAWGSKGSAHGQFVSPTSLAVDSSYVYVVDRHNYRIQKFSKAGAFVVAWGSYGFEPEQFSHGNGITTDGSHVYASDLYSSSVKKFSVDGAFIANWYLDGPWYPYRYPDRPTMVNGKLYVSSGLERRVLAMNTDGNVFGMFGDHGSGPGQFNAQLGIANDGTHLYFADTLNHRIQVWGPAPCALPTPTPARFRGATPSSFAAYQPINGSQRLCFRFAFEPHGATLELFNAAGERAARADLGGSLDFCMDIEGMARGVYFARLSFKNRAIGLGNSEVKKVAILR